jgi:DNA-binding LacI/PurR family transcriptional regulator
MDEDTSKNLGTATLADIAEAAGVTPATVSKALNQRSGVSESKRQEILQLIEKTGYQRRASRPNALKLQSITLVAPERFAAGGSVYGEILRNISAEAGQAEIKIALQLLPNEYVTSEYVSALFSAGTPQSIILLGIDEPGVLDAVAQLDCPKVIANGSDPIMRITSVGPDNRFAGWLATRHLLEHGHRDIVHISHLTRRSIRDRLDGFREALSEYDIQFDPDKHLLILPKHGISAQEARVATEAFFAERNPQCTAFFCATDMLAVGVTQALVARGARVPEDYSIIGVDNLPMCVHHAPPLTSIQINLAGIGKTAVRELQDQLLRPETSVRRINLGVQLFPRQSVVAPRSR